MDTFSPTPLDALPDVTLDGGGAIVEAFRARGCATLRDAARVVWELPYGRNADPANPLCVLRDGRGTCSTKHALLARLAREMGVGAIELRLGIYEMSEANTPGVGKTLAAHGLRSLPEAHCYLVLDGTRLDFARKDKPAEPIGALLAEESIAPEQIGEYKRAFHKRYLREVAGDERAAELWAIREACIAALSEA